MLCTFRTPFGLYAIKSDELGKLRESGHPSYEAIRQLLESAVHDLSEAAYALGVPIDEILPIDKD